MIDTQLTTRLPLDGLLAQLATCRAGDAPEAFWFTVGASFMALTKAGYRLSGSRPAWPPAPDDRWRLALEREIQAAVAQWPDQLPDEYHLAWHHHLVPPD